MKIVIPGGSGQVGAILSRALRAEGHQVIVLARSSTGQEGTVAWDGRTLGRWTDQLDGADAVINLAGRSVNCRYTPEHLREMLESRVRSTEVVGQAIARAARPPRTWLQMSTATIYAHRFDAANDDLEGRIGGAEPDAPALWKKSVDIAIAWERALGEAPTPRTRKVALRTAVVLSPDRGGIFDVLMALTRRGLGGPVAGGAQYMSWIHDRDLVRSVKFLLERGDLGGAVNVASPGPLPQAEFMTVLREAAQIRIGLPAAWWMAEVGAFLLRTETELLFKSRRVVPRRLLDAGFAFEFPRWPEAARDLVGRWKTEREVAGHR